MSQNSEYIELLVFKFNNGTITPEELQILTTWYNSHDDEQVTITTKAAESYDEVKSRLLKGLLAKISAPEAKPVKRYRLIKWMSAAAAIFIVALITWQVLEYQELPQGATVVKRSIEPGGYKATLTLTDGRTISLSSEQKGIVAGEKITYDNGVPVTNAIISDSSQNMLALHTPRGGTYHITLPDGTDVWLNAASTIKYPARFSSASRIVQLEGEAYFHVKTAYQKNGQKIPFKVMTAQQEVEVLGTQFNVNSYPEQASVKTTLVEGKVAINDQNNHVVLAPNQQAITKMGKTQVKQVNVYNYTAWRDGKFSFDGKTFEETMDEIARWYDLKIIYENKIPNEELVGDAFRNENIRLALRVLKTAKINYKLDVARRELTIKGK